MPMPVLEETKVNSQVVNKIPAVNNNSNNNNNTSAAVNKTPVKTEIYKKEAIITPTASIGIANKIMNTTAVSAPNSQPASM